MESKNERIGFVCAYAPVALMDAAGFVPYRVLPMGNWPDQAGRLLHDNLCPHVKLVLDRAMQDDMPDLSGMVFVNSCDAMRRMADAWRRVRPRDRLAMIDLPVTRSTASVSFFSGELSRLRDTLSEWAERTITEEDINESIQRYNKLAGLLQALGERFRQGSDEEGGAKLQALYNQAVTEPILQTLEGLEEMNRTEVQTGTDGHKVPVLLMGNVMPDPEAFSLLESCGVRIVEEDLCTGSRMFHPMEVNEDGNVLLDLARGILSRPVCARTFDPDRPGGMAEDIAARARACGAQGVIAHTAKFCDPYLARMPSLREALREAGLPLLVLEGDCTLRSIGQHRTRIQAFVEMLR